MYSNCAPIHTENTTTARSAGNPIDYFRVTNRYPRAVQIITSLAIWLYSSDWEGRYSDEKRGPQRQIWKLLQHFLLEIRVVVDPTRSPGGSINRWFLEVISMSTWISLHHWMSLLLHKPASNDKRSCKTKRGEMNKPGPFPFHIDLFVDTSDELNLCSTLTKTHPSLAKTTIFRKPCVSLFNGSSE